MAHPPHHKPYCVPPRPCKLPMKPVRSSPTYSEHHIISAIW